ncbi:MAG: hypothetical protein KDC46_06330 [Thermoleophilia bacterium]|nr:hypothetical protein [Thermoleophilia bacterium]
MTTTTVTLQLNATNVAGDWATRSAGTSRSGTGHLGRTSRIFRSRRTDEVAVHLFDLRGAVESIRKSPFSSSMVENRTDAVEVGYGTPLMYHGIRFAVGL